MDYETGRRLDVIKDDLEDLRGLLEAVALKQGVLEYKNGQLVMKSGEEDTGEAPQ